MPSNHRELLKGIHTFESLVEYLREKLKWPIDTEDFEELTFDYTPEELGIDPDNAAKIQEIKQLRPLSVDQPWGIFFIKFEPKRLPVVVLRRILGSLATKQRASANSIDRAHWSSDDLLFISNYGEGDARQISFAHFSQPQNKDSLPTLKVLGWNYLDTLLHIDAVAEQLTNKLKWPAPNSDAKTWRETWSSAFTLRNREVITTSRDLSIQLARLARSIRDSIKTAINVETENGPLKKLMKAFKESLLHDITAEEFADMYAQTIAYGLLSARIANPNSTKTSGFAFCTNTNPFVKELMESFLRFENKDSRSDALTIDFDELGVNEVIELLDQANMEAVIRDFGDKNPQEDPVIHFYELFLKEYDASQKIKRGVFYTPYPVVSYIVRSIHELLKTEFGLEDGLADITTWKEMSQKHKDLKIPQGISPEQPFVQILDPATGTGTFLVEVIEVIYCTMKEKWEKEAGGPMLSDVTERWNQYVPKYLLPRLHGYEILMAPYVIAHLKIGLKLYETGYRFDSEERLRVYLTNALEPPTDIGQIQMAGIFPALAHESKAVNRIKSRERFTVIIGNPPYSLTSANMRSYHRSLVEKYKFIEREPIKERGALQLEKILNDDYVKFIALSQNMLEVSGYGLFGMITNHAYLDNPTMRGLRFNLLKSFERGIFTDLGGSAKKQTGELDENVFDIQQGVAIGILVKNQTTCESCYKHIRLLGTRQSKYDQLINRTRLGAEPALIDPSEPLFLFIPRDNFLRYEYNSYIELEKVFDLKSIGFFTSKDSLVVGRSIDDVEKNVGFFQQSNLSDYDLCEKVGIKAKKAWDVTKSRKLLAEISDLKSGIVSFLHRPFDKKFVFYDKSLVWSMATPVNRNLLNKDNIALVVSRQVASLPWNHVFCSNTIVELCYITNRTKEGNHVFPLYIFPKDPQKQFTITISNSRKHNFKKTFTDRFLGLLYHKSFNIEQDLVEELKPESIFEYIYALLHSASYRSRYAEFLKFDFPRIPLTTNTEFFFELARLGKALVSLHLMRFSNLTTNICNYFGPRCPNVGRVGWSNDVVWLDCKNVVARDDYFAEKPGTIGFSCVPEEVWKFRIGSYQVCHKWLKDRKGRTLSDEDIIHYQKIIVAIKETIKIMNEIDVVIEQYGGWPDAFKVK